VRRLGANHVSRLEHMVSHMALARGCALIVPLSHTQSAEHSSPLIQLETDIKRQSRRGIDEAPLKGN
jgi:hypothetical protein